MSYFIVISGKSSESVQTAEGRLVPISQAQPYVALLASRIAAMDGNPSFFWDDGKTGTSDELVCAAEDEALEGRPIEASGLGRAIKSCEQHHVSARIWWATNEPDAFMKVSVLSSSAEALAMLQQQSGKGAGIGFVMQPHRGAP